MVIIRHTFLFFVLIPQICFAQWYQQNPLPTLRNVSLFNVIAGAAVGDEGTILRTINSGIIWNKQTSGTTQDLFDVSFTDPSTGTAVGEGGIILHTAIQPREAARESRASG